ncbi:MAG: hypothetical protein JW894_09665, partial [Bacteroidales bacterium]|nr:hypothetical protein [Bacteroidales bacterium]
MIKLVTRFILITGIVVIASVSSVCQTTIPEIFETGTLSEQFDYLEERTRIYEDYRAIMEDMFQMIKKNSGDSLSSAKIRISGLISETGNLNSQIDSLNKSLSSTKDELREMTRTKNNISIFGINLNKYAYNTIVLIIIGALGFLLVTGFLAFKRNLTITSNTKKELTDLKDEFEEYRKKT